MRICYIHLFTIFSHKSYNNLSNYLLKTNAYANIEIWKRNYKI